MTSAIGVALLTQLNRAKVELRTSYGRIGVGIQDVNFEQNQCSSFRDELSRDYF